MKKILIVEVNWIGDVLFSTPFIRAVREANPDSFIACLVHPRCREMLEANPRVNEIIIYDEELAHRSILGKAGLVMKLRRMRFDTAFILHRSFTKALLTRLAGIGRRIGYATKGRGFLLTDPVNEPPPQTHKVEYFLDMARAVGIGVTSRSYEMFITEDDRKALGGILSGEGITGLDRIVVINAGGNWGPKRWPKENFAKLADELINRYAVRIVISGAAKDIGLAEDIKNSMAGKAVITAGKTTLRQLGALAERSSLVISNDSGPMHIAVGMNANVIALFGPTSPELTGPYGPGRYKVIAKNDSCRIPCYDKSCTDNACMSAITVDEVLSEACKVLGGYRR